LLFINKLKNMINTLTYLLGSISSKIFPFLGAISPTCRVNGEVVACPDFLTSGAPIGILGALGAFFLFFPALMLVFVIIVIVAMWIIFEKAGKPGWAAIVPIYNCIILLEIVKKPTWWVIFLFIPFVNIVVSIIVTYHLALAFGKSAGFAVGMILLPFIFYPILAFGKSTYQLGEKSDFSQNVPPQPMPPQPNI
jgi:hypothetical protein